jgi:hypothetical protein
MTARRMPVIDYKRHALIFTNKTKPDSFIVAYQRYPHNFERVYFHKDPSILYRDLVRPTNPFTIRYNNNAQQNIFANDGLNKNGNISRGISFGNNQDVVVNSNLNLQVSGKLTPEIDLLMAATDNNIPFQADGTTAQLQEFDKVFIQLSNHNTKMIVGDYQLSRPQNSYFMNFYKRAQGFYLDNNYLDTTGGRKPMMFRTQLSGAVSRGKFSRMVFFGTENNQGPYRLRGAENEPFIIVLSGTEKIYIDGRLLERGQENDYIIDYNTGEISFTAKQLITKDKRIVAEFQYAERNYSRSLFFFGEEISADRTKVFLNFFTEQDNKNRPLLQELSQPQKDIMIEAGDTLVQAVSSGVELADYNTGEVFYRRTDSLANGGYFPNVYVYSNNAELARYRIRFSNVGFGNGNYNQISSTANGKVFVWTAPVNGQKMGTYDTVIPLVTPKQHQMVTGGFTHSITSNNILTAEGVYTKNDINKFSTQDKGNDEGSGVKIGSKNKTVLKKDSLSNETSLLYNVNYEFVQKQFTQVERFRSIEFDRDWNRPLNSFILNDQHIASAEVGINRDKKGALMYGYQHFSEGDNYKGQKQLVNASYNYGLFTGNYAGSYLLTDDNLNSQSTRFYRHKSIVSRKIERIKLQYADEFENNIFINRQSGDFLPKAYQFWEWEGSISNADTSGNTIKVFYRERRDKLAYTPEELKDSTHAVNIGMRADVFSIRNNPFTVLITYRELRLKNASERFLKPDNSLLNRLEYNPRYFKGFITANMFYETGYGVENKKEFYYLEVAPGQGQYAWNDYNGNDIKELNEFEVARFADQARFIRVYTPTNEYMKVLQNQLSLSFSLRPSAVIKNATRKMNSFISRWWTQTAIRIDNKIAENKEKGNYNPLKDVKDSFLLASNNSVRQSLFFNQTSAIFGADYSYIRNQSRQLLTNGIEGRNLESHEIKWRVSFSRSWSINSNNMSSRRSNRSEFFSTRNYDIRAIESEQRLIYQPNTIFRLSGIYKYDDKINVQSELAKEQAWINSYGLEVKYNQTEKGSLTGRADFIQIIYNGNENSPAAYEMLNGLNTGNNFTWEVHYQRNLN